MATKVTKISKATIASTRFLGVREAWVPGLSDWSRSGETTWGTTIQPWKREPPGDPSTLQREFLSYVVSRNLPNRRSTQIRWDSNFQIGLI